MRTIHRTTAVMALALAGALGAACSSDSSDRVATPATDAPAENEVVDTEVDATEVVDTAPAETEVADTAPATEVPSTDISITDALATADPGPAPVEIVAPFEASPDDPDFVLVDSLFPWDGGFLAIAVLRAPQPLPTGELPEEIRALFPQEVLDLFPDGLPSTQAEAMEILEEAGLMDVVMEVIDAHPEAQDAILDVPSPPPEIRAMWTEDGDVWEPIELGLPEGLGNTTRFVVNAGRLTVAGSTMLDDGTAQVTVASSADLVDWTTDTFVTDPLPEVPDEVDVMVLAVAGSANDRAWAVQTVVEAFLDPYSILTDEARALLEGDHSDETRSEIATDSDGIRIEQYEVDADGETGYEPIMVTLFTWEELGVDEAVREYVRGGPMTTTSWFAPWGGEPAVIETDSDFATIVATEEAVVVLANDSWSTTDGVTHQPVEMPVLNLQVGTVSPLGDGLLVSGWLPGGDMATFRTDGTMSTWQELPLPEPFGDAVGGWAQHSSPVAVVGFWESQRSLEQQVVVEHEGYTLTLDYGEVEAYRLVDADGELVVEESIDYTTTERPDDGPFEHLVQDEDGITISDPVTGEPIVNFPARVVDGAWQQLWEESGVDDDMPDWWLLVTTDGETWTTIDYDEGDDPEAVEEPYLAAANERYVLVGTVPWAMDADAGAWLRYELD